ncbi:MAG: hypothetical protein AB1714_14000 [Acidobacteriota bacterium]
MTRCIESSFPSLAGPMRACGALLIVAWCVIASLVTVFIWIPVPGDSPAPVLTRSAVCLANLAGWVLLYRLFPRAASGAAIGACTGLLLVSVCLLLTTWWFMVMLFALVPIGVVAGAVVGRLRSKPLLSTWAVALIAGAGFPAVVAGPISIRQAHLSVRFDRDCPIPPVFKEVRRDIHPIAVFSASGVAAWYECRGDCNRPMDEFRSTLLARGWRESRNDGMPGLSTRLVLDKPDRRLMISADAKQVMVMYHVWNTVFTAPAEETRAR